jgi:hypothetical protein
MIIGEGSSPETLKFSLHFFMKRFNISAIRPILEYEAQVWHGDLTKAQSSSVEKVQRRALRIIYSEKKYEKSLLEAGMHTLEQRRNTMCIDLISLQSLSEVVGTHVVLDCKWIITVFLHTIRIPLPSPSPALPPPQSMLLQPKHIKPDGKWDTTLNRGRGRLTLC